VFRIQKLKRLKLAVKDRLQGGASGKRLRFKLV
jgi:hypothetical protein